MKRAQELEPLEKEAASARHTTVAELTSSKRLLLTREMLVAIDYEDVDAISLLEQGATLAGEVEASPAFETQFKPCLATVAQLEADAVRRNQLVLQLACSSGSEEVDLQLLAETQSEVERGCAEGPIDPNTL
jgi:hypothetical protein